MAYTAGNSTGQFSYDASTSATQAFSGGVTAGSLLSVQVGSFDGADVAATVTDSQSNTYTKDKSVKLAAGNWVSVWSAIAGSTGANSVTVSTGVGGYMTAWGQEFLSPAATPLDQTNSNTGTGNAATPGSVTPSEDNELIVAAYDDGTSASYTAPTGYTTLANQPNNTIHSSLYSGYKIQTTAGAENPSLGLSGSLLWAGVIATYKAAAAGAAFIAGPPLVINQAVQTASNW